MLGLWDGLPERRIHCSRVDKDKDQDQDLLIPDLKMENVRLNSVTDSLQVLENEEVVSSVEDKSNVPLKNKANLHSIYFFESIEISADRYFWEKPHIVFDTGNPHPLLPFTNDFQFA
jgi:hypothetical protein